MGTSWVRQGGDESTWSVGGFASCTCGGCLGMREASRSPSRTLGLCCVWEAQVRKPNKYLKLSVHLASAPRMPAMCQALCYFWGVAW